MYLWYVLLLLVPLLLLQSGLHREIQAILLLLTRRNDITVVLFSLLFLPGVLLHEGSHFLVARLLGVRTGRFSIVPRPLEDGRVQLGYVETARADPLRDALIGTAPLLLGGAFVAYAGLKQLGLVALWQGYSAGGLASVFETLPALSAQPDFWLWFYLAFTVSSTMMPSASDRRAWLPVGLFALFLLAISLLFGAGPWLAEHLAAPLNQVLLAVAIVLGISASLHLILLLPAWGLRCLLSWAMNAEVV